MVQHPDESQLDRRNRVGRDPSAGLSVWPKPRRSGRMQRYHPEAVSAVIWWRPGPHLSGKPCASHGCALPRPDSAGLWPVDVGPFMRLSLHVCCQGLACDSGLKNRRDPRWIVVVHSAGRRRPSPCPLLTSLRSTRAALLRKKPAGRVRYVPVTSGPRWPLFGEGEELCVSRAVCGWS